MTDMATARDTTRRLLALACVATSGALLASGCTRTEPTPAPVSVAVPADKHLLALAHTSVGVVLITPKTTVTVAAEGATPSATGSPAAVDRAQGGSVDLDGSAWLVQADGQIVSPAGDAHPASAASAALEGDSSTSAGPQQRRPDAWGTAVVDGQTALVPTVGATGSTYWHAEDSVVHRVTVSGATDLAGTTDRTAPTVGALPTGSSAPATAVRLERVQAIVPMRPDEQVLLMNAPTAADEATSSRLQGAVVEGSSIRRLALPDLCAGQYAVRASRVSDHEIVVSAPTPTARGGGCSTTSQTWVKVDVTTGASTPLGSGLGLATLDGERLVTATRADPMSSTVSIAWAAPPSS